MAAHPPDPEIKRLDAPGSLQVSATMVDNPERLLAQH